MSGHFTSLESCIGQSFGQLTVIAVVPGVGHGRQLLCRCSCGSEKAFYLQSLQCRESPTCGVKGFCKNPNITQKTYRSWESMMARCFNEKHEAYLIYGGAGVTVCESWKDINKFFEDMGNRPDGKTLDRFPDNKGNYCKENCRWANWKEQNRNKPNNHVLTVNGVSRTISEWAELTGLWKTTIRMRLKCGWTSEDAIRPVSPRG